MTTYLRNAWYVAALAKEVEQGRAMARTILGERVAFFRDAVGAPVALYDRCPHRFAQLHKGKVLGNFIECPYHGLTFDGLGKCVRNPHGDGIVPSRAAVKSYPTAERHNVVWIWPGDPALADVSRIPHMSIFESPERRAIATGYMHTGANYELVTDNLMDLSHADYVHKTSLNTAGMFSGLKPTVQSRENTVHVRWEYETDTVQPFFRSTMRNPDGRAVQSFDMTWYAPSNMLLAVAARDADLSVEADAIYTTAHLLTPETHESCHYFVVETRNWDMSNTELTAALHTAVMSAFTEEDKPAVEAVQESMETSDFWSLQPVLLSCDPGAIQARRVLSRLIAAESVVDNRNVSEAQGT